MTRLADLVTLGRADLARLWSDLIGGDVPASMSQPMQRRFLAFELQARTSGGLPPAFLARLDRIETPIRQHQDVVADRSAVGVVGTQHLADALWRAELTARLMGRFVRDAVVPVVRAGALPPENAWEWMQRVAVDVQIAIKERTGLP